MVMIPHSLRAPPPPPPPPPAPSKAPPKLKRSRNGCVECRRLHRRCDEEKPACASCRAAGKVCSYQKPLSWGGRPFGKSTFRHALGRGVVEIPIAEASGSVPAHRRSFVYGSAEAPSSVSNVSALIPPRLARSRSVPSTPANEENDSSSSSPTVDGGNPQIWLPWLSQHHRMLLQHFTDSTIVLFTGDASEQLEIRSTIVPMAVDTNHGFSLLAAIISLASTHRMTLGLHQDRSEIEYWRDMSVGHLRRPAVHEDESTENVFAGTALMLAIRDVISDVETSSSWRIHLQGALTVLTRVEDRPEQRPPSPGSRSRAMLQKIARSLQIRSPLPSSSSRATTTDDKKKRVENNVHVLGLPSPLGAILHRIRTLRLERNALHNIESNSGSGNMQPLWNSLRGQSLDIVVQLKSFSEEATSRSSSSASTSSLEADKTRLYSHIALIQVYSGVLDLPTTDVGVLSTLDTAISILRTLRLETRPAPETDLLLALFTIGCLAHRPEDRKLVHALLTRTEHGKRNAVAARTFLEELWMQASGGRKELVKQADVDALMTEKGWDLSLW